MSASTATNPVQVGVRALVWTALGTATIGYVCGGIAVLVAIW